LSEYETTGVLVCGAGRSRTVWGDRETSRSYR